MKGQAADQLLDDAALEAAFRVMARVRAFEESVARAFRAGEIPGVVHVSLRQEALAGALASVGRAEDSVFSTHRGHGHCIARGVPLRALWAELLAKDEGVSRGRGGSMHVFSPDHGVMGTNGIVGANVPLAVGHALSVKLGANSGITFAFFGEGSVATGAFHEALQLAALWKVPVVLVCENNGFAEFTSFDRWATFESVASFVGRYEGVETKQCDGRDVDQTAAALRWAVELADEGRPCLVEAFTSRGSGHYEGDAQAYREVDPDDPDPLALCRAELLARGPPEPALDAALEAEREAVAVAKDEALALPEPDPATLLEHV